MDLKAAVTTDVVKSSSLTDEQRRALDQNLRRMFASFNSRFDHELSAIFDFSLGDEFQAVFAPPDLAIRRVYSMHAFLASQLPEGPVRVRSAIGIGRVSVAESRVPREQDGPAFHIARKLIDALDHDKLSVGIVCQGQTPLLKTANHAFDIGCRLIHAITNSWTRAQWEVAYWKWEGKTVREISEILAIQPQNVFKRLKSAQFATIQQALEGFEAILREPALIIAIRDSPDDLLLVSP
jgi:hypothetical protein